MIIGAISDLHLYNKTDNLIKALKCLHDADILLLAGDLADRGRAEQYELLKKCLDEYVPSVPIFCVSGNHDNPSCDDRNYRNFVASIKDRTEGEAVFEDDSGAYKAAISEDIDLYGLNPVYHTKVFSFANRGQQLAFLEKALDSSETGYHIILCHAPLIKHNPLRDADSNPYFPPEQDKRLQNIVDKHRNIIFVSGHTHITPSVEFEAERNNLYINNGSIRPTTVKGSAGDTQQGNITKLVFSDKALTVTIYGIYSGIELYKGELSLPDN